MKVNCTNNVVNLIINREKMYKLVVWVMLEKNREILLLKKPDNSEWTFTGGHVEDNESLKMAAVRIVSQQTSINLNQDDLEILCVVDREMDSAYKFHVFFKALSWQGELENTEPNVHSEIKWHNLETLPDNIGVLAAAGVESLKTKNLYHFIDNPEPHTKH